MNRWGICESREVGGPPVVSRRNLLAGASLGLLAWMTRQTALAQVGLGDPGRTGNTLVVVFLRGGADGLSLVVPYGDDGYYRARPTLSLPADRLHRLDDLFGLHPSLSALAPLYEAGTLAAIHAVGSDDRTRSHFEAMNTMERGIARREGPQSGWVARYLEAAAVSDPSPLRAVAFASTTPTSLVGASHAATLESLADFRLHAPPRSAAALADLYAHGDDAVAVGGRQTLAVLRTLERIDPRQSHPENGAAYPDSPLGQGLRQTACLIRAGVGMEVACLDHGGWDTHVGQGVFSGLLPLQLQDLGQSLAAFARDLGSAMRQTTVVVMSEFGRRIAENAGLGTDHGHGGAMITFGGGVAGGRVLAKWPGLDHPVGPGDLAVTTDYRDVLAEVMAQRLGVTETHLVFPDHRPTPLRLYHASAA